MKSTRAVLLALALALAFLPPPTAAQEHTVTRLGSPSSRFTRALQRPDEVRLLVRGERTRADVAAILEQAGWKGRFEDLERAAAAAEITVAPVAPGTRLPFMASRRNGQPRALRDVLWAGRRPIEAFTFEFSSQCMRYRFRVPHACGNFWVDEIGKDTEDPKCAPPPLKPVVEVSVAAEACVTQPLEVSVTVRNPPLDRRVTLTVGGREIASDTLKNSSFQLSVPGSPKPGAVEVKATSGGVSGTTTVQVKACPPACSIGAPPSTRAGRPFTVDLAGSRVATGVAGGIRAARIEVLRDGAVVHTNDVGAVSRTGLVIRKSGPHTLRATVTDEAGQVSTNTCETSVDVAGGFPLFAAGYFGKERLVHDDGDKVGAHCTPLAGFQVGVQPRLGERAELEAAFGVKIAADGDEGDTSVFGDVAVNGLIGHGFLGAGFSFWDLTESDTRAVGLLVQGGVDLTRDGRWQVVAQARAPFGELDDLDNNYQLWGGLRFRPNSWR